MKIHLSTHNPGKIKAAKSVFDKYNIDILLVEKEYPEIQADSSLEVAKYSAIQAAKDLGVPVVREDHSLFINALRFPGPYTNYFEKKIPPSILLEWLKNYDDRDGFFEIAAVYAKPDGFFKEFIYQVPITIALKEKGKLQKGWARVLMLKNDKRTFAEYPEQERLSVWNKNYQAIAMYIKNDI
ncbi:MAG: non-canonical purine NTP pyrophosphatase [Candidatus Paceibacterota bacterium]|jgi:non-canonical purine NTP pyrophosphatase (RdgB/HAM1 family)